MMMVIRLIINNEANFLYIPFSIMAYSIVYLLGKNQKIGEGKFGYVGGLRVNLHPGWKRQIAQQVAETATVETIFESVGQLKIMGGSKTVSLAYSAQNT